MSGRARSHRRSPREIGRRLLLAAASGLLVLAAADGLMRWLDYRPTQVPLFEERPDGVSYQLRPGASVHRTVDGVSVSLVTNSLGMRGPELDPPSDRPRVALMGDSFTFGLWAEDAEHTFAGVLQQHLGRDRLEVLNFGVPGYGFKEITIALAQDVLPLHPRWVVLVSYNGNDFLDTWTGLIRYRVSANGSLERDTAAIADKLPMHLQREHPIPHSRFIDRSPVVMLARVAARWALPGRAPPLDPGDSWNSDLYWSRAEYTDFAVQARDGALAELARIDALCREQDARLVLVAMPYLQQVMQPERFGDELDIDVPQRYLAGFADAHGVPFLDLRPGMAQAAQRLFIEGEGHMTNAGHAVVGRLLGDFLAPLIAPPLDSVDVAPGEQHQGQAQEQR